MERGKKKKRQQNNKKDEEYFNRLDKVRWQKKKDEAIHPARFFFLFFFVLLYTTLKCRHTRSREQERWPVVVVQPSQSNGFTFKNMCCVCVLSWCVHSCLAPSRIRQFKGRRIKRKEEAIWRKKMFIYNLCIYNKRWLHPPPICTLQGVKANIRPFLCPFYYYYYSVCFCSIFVQLTPFQIFAAPAPSNGRPNNYGICF